MTPSPFQIGQGIGNTFGQAQERQSDLSAIDQILANAGQTGDSAAYDNAIGQILSHVSPQRQQSALAVLQGRQKRIQETAEKQAIKQQYEAAGYDPEMANLPPELRKAEIEKRKKASEAEQTRQSGQNILNRMKDLRATGHLGWKVGQNLGLGLLSPTVRKDRSEYERLGKALIQYSTNIPIRNRLEFEAFAHDLSDPTIDDATAAGILDAMQTIIGEAEGEKSQQSESAAPGKKPLNAFMVQ